MNPCLFPTAISEFPACAAASRPLTGGSGGGANDATWTEPEPPHVFGMNAMVAYGANVQIACPLNFQMAFGSNLQLCINPSSFLELYGDASVPMSPLMTQWLGGGAGGNLQLTMGTNAQVVMGQIFDINMGPKRITIDVHKQQGIQAVCAVLGSILWISASLALIAYALPIPDLANRHGDDQRSITLITYQSLTQVLLTLLMNVQKLYQNMDADFRDTLDTAFGWNINRCGSDRGFATAFDQKVNGWLLALLIVAAMVPPVLLESLGEAELDHPGQPQPGDVVDDKGNIIGHETGGDPVVDSQGHVIGHEQ